MIVKWSNYKDYYKNPTPQDFQSSNVWLRRTHLNDIISNWNDWNEDDFGVIDWINNQQFSVIMELKKAPNIVKIITNDGTEWFFYKEEQPAIVSEADKTISTIIYTLNKWDTYLWKKFFQLNEMNPVVETLNLHSDIIIFYWSLGRILDLGITSFVVNGITERSLRDCFNFFIRATSDDWKTGDINPYYSINYEELDITELSDLQVNDTVSIVKFSDDFKVNQISDTPPAFYGIDFDDGNPSLYIADLGGGMLEVQYKSTNTPQDDAPIWTSTNGFTANDYDWVDGTHWDAATKTLTFPSSKTIVSNNITSDNYSGSAGRLNGGKVKIVPRSVNGKSYLTTDRADKTDLGYIELDITLGTPQDRVDILYYKLNILEQKQFSDTRADDNFQLIRKYIGSKSREQLYDNNQVSEKNTIVFSSYGDSTQTHPMSLDEFDTLSWDDDKKVFKQIACKNSAVKNIIWDTSSSSITGIESLGGQYQLFIPVGDREIALFDKIGDWLEPTPTNADSTKNPEPKPQMVQIAPFASGSKLTDATLSDFPNGLFGWLALQQLSSYGAEPLFANLGEAAWSSGASEIYTWSDSGSIPYIKLPTNKAVKIKISDLDEPNSLEYKIKTLFNNIVSGIYDADTEPLFLNPKYFYEAIVYDNTNFIRIDTSWINYEILANELLSDGLVLEANVCITNDFAMWYTFASASGNGKIGNNELNQDWNITHTNLWVDNNRTTMELGSNAENLANGGALAAQVGYLNNKTTIEQQNRNNVFSQIGNAFGALNDALGGVVNMSFLGAKKSVKTIGGITGGLGDVMGMFQQQENFKDTILQENRSYNAGISQVKSANAVDVSLPYQTSFGNQDGLFSRSCYEIQDWNKRSKFLEINKTGYIYRDSNYFQVWDNRLYWNTIRISANQNYHYIIQKLQQESNDVFSAYVYCEELLLWLMGGITICNLYQLPDFETLQNLPKILPPASNQKQKADWTKYINQDELSSIGLIGDDTMSWDIDGDLRKRIIDALSSHSINAPSDLWDDLNSANFTFQIAPETTTLVITCLSSDEKYYGILTLSNIIVVSKSDYLSRIGSFVINDYANNKDYFDLHISYQVQYEKEQANWDSVDYTFTDENTLHIEVKNTLLNISVLDYTIVKSDTQSIGIDTLWNPKNWNPSTSQTKGTMGWSGFGTIYFGGGNVVDLSGSLQSTNKNLVMVNFACGNNNDEDGTIGLTVAFSYDFFNKTTKMESVGGSWSCESTDETSLHITQTNVGNVYCYSDFNRTTTESWDNQSGKILINNDVLSFSVELKSIFNDIRLWVDNDYQIEAISETDGIQWITNVDGDRKHNITPSCSPSNITLNGITISDGSKQFTFGGFTWE